MIYMTKAQAIAEYFNYEGYHFGVPVWCEYDDSTGAVGAVAAKFVPLEFVLTLGAYFTQFLNQFREPGEEYMFAFLIRPIE